MKLTTAQKMKVLNTFADYKIRSGSKSVVIQSLPSYGVQADYDFYSLESIVTAIEAKLKGVSK